MNESTAIFLVNDDVCCVRCAYELPLQAAQTPKNAGAGWAATQAAIGGLADWRDPSNYNPSHLNYFKSFDKGLKVGDYAVVPTDTRWKFTVVRVIEINADFDPETNEQMKWIVGSVELDDHEEILEKENAIISATRRAHREAKKAELRRNLVMSHPEYLKGLDLVNVALPSAVEQAAPASVDKEPLF